jgi:DNA-directed RNA polymerase specialized sigma54-like protein
VLECYEHLNECGYFRDSYNNSNVLSQFGLDWWGDVIPLLDPEGMLSPEKAERLLALLDEHEQEFEANVRELRRESRAYFEKKATQLRAFLAEAIRLAEPIECSL